MWKIKRRHLGSSITVSPVEEMQRWALANISRLIFAAVSCVVWFGVYYGLSGIIVFLGTHVATIWSRDSITAMEIFNHPVSGIVKIVGCVVIFIYVIYSTNKTR